MTYPMKITAVNLGKRRAYFIRLCSEGDHLVIWNVLLICVICVNEYVWGYEFNAEISQMYVAITDSKVIVHRNTENYGDD